MRKFKLLICVLLVIVLTFQFTACNEQKEEEKTEEQTQAEEGDEIALVYPENGASVSLLTEEMTEWLKTCDRDELDVLCDYTEKCTPVPVSFEWTSENAENVSVVVGLKEDLSDGVRYEKKEDTITAEDLLPGQKYYFRFEYTAGGAEKYSKTYVFETLDQPRTVNIPGVSNVRDLGGAKTTDGRRVRFNAVFRGADLVNITDEGKEKAVKTLGIKTELDLRGDESGGISPFGESVNYLYVEAPYYENVNSEEYADDIVSALKIFADKGNYPIYFHCSLGRDRTGTLAYILYAIAGVEEQRIYADYETSFFSSVGGYGDGTRPSAYIIHFDTLRYYLSGSSENPMSYKKLRRFLTHLGLTDEELAAIRENLLEP